MGSLAKSSDELRSMIDTLIIGQLAGLRRGSVVSANAVAADLIEALPDCELPAEQLARLVSEAAMLLGLVPVINPAGPARRARGIVRFGYGHPAHRPDPLATYAFNPGPPRTFPVQGTRGLRLVK